MTVTDRAEELVRVHRNGTMISARELIAAIEGLLNREEPHGYVGVVEQAQKYLAGDREYSSQANRWMVEGLVRLLDARYTGNR